MVQGQGKFRKSSRISFSLVVVTFLVGNSYFIEALETSMNLIPRIVGGEVCQEGEFPWQISLRVNGNHICGGSIINENWIITAGHCCIASSVSSYSVRAGVHNIRFPESESQLVGVSKVMRHENFSSTTYINDLALMKLTTPVKLGDAFRTAAITMVPKETNITGKSCTITGWGYLDEDGKVRPAELRKVEIPIVSDDVCRKSYGASNIHDTMFCAGLPEGTKDSCQGDSGGPAVVKDNDGNHQLCGIVSWGQGCARPNYYGVYTEVSYFSDWIKTSMAAN